MTEVWDRLIAAEGINNFRDYGGWRTSGGGRVRTGLLFRSAHHARASEADAQLLQRLGVAVVTDLRHPAEQSEQPSAWLGRLPLTVIDEADPAGTGDGRAPHITALENSDFSHAALRQFMIDNYAVMPYDPRLVAAYRRYFQALANEDGAILIHCAAGKDRTGLLAALTHRVLAVHPDDIMEDYLLTNTAANIGERLPNIKQRMTEQYGRPIDDAALLAMLQVEEEYLANSWRALDARSGSVQAYLADVMGLDEPAAARIRERLIR